jgi:hypothetical protein
LSWLVPLGAKDTREHAFVAGDLQTLVGRLGGGAVAGQQRQEIMGAISRSMAGVGSAVNDSTRLIGGTLGVAVIGSVYASVYGSRLTATLPAAVPPQVGAIARQSLGAAYTAAGTATTLGHPALGQALHLAATNAFLRGLTVGSLVAGGVALAGALLTAVFLPAQPAQPDHPTRTALAAEGDRQPAAPASC